MSPRRCVAVAAVLLLSLGASLPASADAVSDLRAEGERIAAKKDKLHEQSEVIAEKINGSTVELQNIEKDIAVALVQLGEQDANLSALNLQARQFAVNSYILGSASNGLGTILAPGGIGNDSAQRDGYSSVLLGGSADVTDQVKAVRQDTDRIKAGLVTKQKRQVELAASLEQNRAQIDRAQAAIQALGVQNNAALAEAVAAAEEATRIRLEAAAAERIRVQSAAFRQTANDAASAPASTGRTVTEVQAVAKPGAVARPVVVAPAAPGKPAITIAAPAPKGTAAPSPAATTPPRPTPPPAPAVSGAAGRAVAAAYSQLGVPYKFATSSPGVSFDCSGLTSWAWSQAGVSIPRTSQEQWAGLPHVPLDQIQPGDLIFYYSDVHHVAIYVGNNTVIHAPFTGSTVSLSGINGRVIGAARPG